VQWDLRVLSRVKKSIDVMSYPETFIRHVDDIFIFLLKKQNK